MDLANRLEKYIHEKGVSNEDMFKLLNVCLFYGNIKRVSDFAKDRNITPQAVYQYYETKKILGVKVVFDNY